MSSPADRADLDRADLDRADLDRADLDRTLAGLHGCTAPYLIGVRHHSPALSVVLPALLDAYQPEVLLLELPPEFTDWLPWLADPGTSAPVALAGVAGPGAGPAFYPFADFSPELVAIRWAARAGVPVRPCDLPPADPAWHRPDRANGQPRHHAAGPASGPCCRRRRSRGRAGPIRWDSRLSTACRSGSCGWRGDTPSAPPPIGQGPAPSMARPSG